MPTTGDTSGGEPRRAAHRGRIEYRFQGSPRSVRAEYRYRSYEAGVDHHQGMLGLAYRF